MDKRELKYLLLRLNLYIGGFNLDLFIYGNYYFFWQIELDVMHWTFAFRQDYSYITILLR